MAEKIMVLRVKPMEEPELIEIENTLESLHEQGEAAFKQFTHGKTLLPS